MGWTRHDGPYRTACDEIHTSANGINRDDTSTGLGSVPLADGFKRSKSGVHALRTEKKDGVGGDLRKDGFHGLRHDFRTDAPGVTAQESGFAQLGRKGQGLRPRERSAPKRVVADDKRRRRVPAHELVGSSKPGIEGGRNSVGGHMADPAVSFDPGLPIRTYPNQRLVIGQRLADRIGGHRGSDASLAIAKLRISTSQDDQRGQPSRTPQQTEHRSRVTAEGHLSP